MDMRAELLTLAKRVMEARGWEPWKLEKAFGSPKLLYTIEHGKNGPTIGTAERFQKWLQDQLQNPRGG